MKRTLSIVALLFVASGLLVAQVGPDHPMRKRTLGNGDPGGDDPAVTCSVHYYQSCAISKKCVSDSHAWACCNDCIDRDGTHLPCATCVAN